MTKVVAPTTRTPGCLSSSQTTTTNKPTFSKQIHLVGKHFRLKIHQNTTDSYFSFYVSVSIRDLHHQKLVLVLPVLGTKRTWRAKKAVVCVTESIAAFIVIHRLCTFLVDVYGLLDQPGKMVWFCHLQWDHGKLYGAHWYTPKTKLIKKILRNASTRFLVPNATRLM